MGVNNNMNLGSLIPALQQVELQGGRGVIVHNSPTAYDFTNEDRGNIVVGRVVEDYNLTTAVLDPFSFGDKLILVNATQDSPIDFYFDVDLVQNSISTPLSIPIGYSVELTYLYDFEDVTPTWSLELVSFEVSSGGSARTTSTSGTESSPDTQSNYTLIHEAGATPTLTFEFPPNPINNQKVTLMSVGGITALTLSATVGTIVNAITTLAVGGASTYMYFLTQDKWYKVG